MTYVLWSNDLLPWRGCFSSCQSTCSGGSSRLGSRCHTVADNSVNAIEFHCHKIIEYIFLTLWPGLFLNISLLHFCFTHCKFTEETVVILKTCVSLGNSNLDNEPIVTSRSAKISSVVVSGTGLEASVVASGGPVVALLVSSKLPLPWAIKGSSVTDSTSAPNRFPNQLSAFVPDLKLMK